ncbi:uncharacterized protein I206_101596 [Kwoniella pini CBS 10737]|uniref:Protein YOP1 n=1 Tax=Kwoniella pini CBS 10737 TaxID=1296096 RepID=A0A1B9HW83_9TREE|nr:uncharacterized protein I206_06434 [Kwoniella pini CBS 10737]OCF47533.1 hypothetical protein I206_06434 [Kwoniella pini CBS 10737]
MDPTTFAHVDHSGYTNADLTAKQPTVYETSGLTTSTIPPGAAPPHLGAASEGFNNPFETSNTSNNPFTNSKSSSSPPTAPVNPIKQSYPETQIYRETQAGQSDFADIHARSTTSDRNTTEGTARQNLSDATTQASDKANEVTTQASNKVNEVTTQASNKANEAASQASTKASQFSEQVQQKANEAATGIRQRVRKLSVDLNNAADHPAVKNAKGTANNYIAQFREQLGRSETIRDLEKRTNVDRVVLVVGGVLGYILLIPLNILRLALPITDLLTILPATYLSAIIIDKPETTANDQQVKSLLSFFVVLGAIQTLESLMAGVLENRIPQYFTIKLLFLAYLLHPRTQGATQVHEKVFKPLLASAQRSSKQAPPPSSSTYPAPNSASKVSTPPTSKESLSTASSPQTTGFTTMATFIPLPNENDNITRADARGQGYAVVTEVPNF